MKAAFYKVISNKCDCGCQVCVVRIRSDSVLVSFAESQRQESAKGAAQEVVRQLVFLCDEQHHGEGRPSCKATTANCEHRRDVLFVLQLSSSHHSIKDGEGRSKKLSSHGHGHRSKKTGGAGKSCSSSSCSSSPFNTGAGQPANRVLRCCCVALNPKCQTQMHRGARV